MSKENIETGPAQGESQHIGQSQIIIYNQDFGHFTSPSSPCFLSGIVNQTLAPPPGRFSAPTRPPCASAIALTIGNPKPMPYCAPRGRSTVTKRLNKSPNRSGGR